MAKAALTFTEYTGETPMDVIDAKDLLGWKPESESGVKYGDDFFLRDMNGEKVRLLKNGTNRPFTRSWAIDLAGEYLRKQHKMNAETIKIDDKGNVQDGQHRLVGLIFAEQMRLKNVAKWKEEYGWNGPIKAEYLVVHGISHKPEVLDTLNGGKRGTLGDIFYRNREFKDVTPKQLKTLGRIQAGAVRLAWIRLGGLKVSDAKKFPPTEALAFLKKHEKITEAVKVIWELDAGVEGESMRISSSISLSYAAAMLYLMSAVKTKLGKDASYTQWNKAVEFWTTYASLADLPATSPILVLNKALKKMSAGSGAQRDEIVGMVVKAFNAWFDGKSVTTKDIQVEKKRVDGKARLVEDPRLGGLDVVVEEPEPDVEVKPAKEKKVTVKTITEDVEFNGTEFPPKGKKAKAAPVVAEAEEVAPPKKTPAKPTIKLAGKTAKLQKELAGMVPGGGKTVKKAPPKKRGAAAIQTVEDEPEMMDLEGDDAPELD